MFDISNSKRSFSSASWFMSQTLKSNIEIIAFHNLDASAYQRGISKDMVGMKVPCHDIQNHQ